MMDIYDEKLLERHLHPRHKREMPRASFAKDIWNASCGDKTRIYFKTKDGRVVDGSWTGTGCAISQVAADVMVEAMIGRKLEEIQKVREELAKAMFDAGSDRADAGTGEMCIGGVFLVSGE